MCRELCVDGVTRAVACTATRVYECKEGCQERASNNLIIDFVMLYMCIF